MSDDEHVWAPNLVLLGDFNVFDRQSQVYRALADRGFRFPHEGADLPATNVGSKARFYDQIGYLFRGTAHVRWESAGVLDFFDAVYSDDKIGMYRDVPRMRNRPDPERYYRITLRRNEMSDHLLLWTELRIEFPERYLENTANPG